LRPFKGKNRRQAEPASGCLATSGALWTEGRQASRQMGSSDQQRHKFLQRDGQAAQSSGNMWLGGMGRVIRDPVNLPYPTSALSQAGELVVS
jgi:hypothetical protein